MKTFLLVAVLAASCTPTDVPAHSWYPEECCSGYNCEFSGPASTNEFGDLVVTDGNRQLVIPDTVPQHPNYFRFMSLGGANANRIPYCGQARLRGYIDER